jgi:hypothetical protein
MSFKRSTQHNRQQTNQSGYMSRKGNGIPWRCEKSPMNRLRRTYIALFGIGRAYEHDSTQFVRNTETSRMEMESDFLWDAADEIQCENSRIWTKYRGDSERMMICLLDME